MLFFDTFKPKEVSSIPKEASINNELSPLTLSWKNISYTVLRKKSDNFWKSVCWRQSVERIQLLKNINGIAESGTLIAIMGPSGAGKTTLLATISQRLKDLAEGDVFINGRPVEQEIMTRISGFVPQEDLAVETLTVQEHMEFMACMKMDRRLRSAVRKQKIAKLLTELGIEKCGDTRLSALSGGERKKVSLAAQLLTEPNILFCDEPTTALDSFGATAVIQTLRGLAERGRIVVCTIHQPTSGLFNLFHKVILLSTGRIAFQGSAADAVLFFDSLDLQCPPSYNEAEFYIKQLSISKDKEAESLEKINRICNEYEKSKFAEDIKKIIERICNTNNLGKIVESSSNFESHIEDYKRIRSLTQIEWLMWRTYIDNKRNLSTIVIKFSFYMLIGFILAVPYINVTKNLNQTSIQNVQGLLYLIITETIFTFNYGVFHTFPKELPLLLRDTASGLYQAGPYYISKVIISIPAAVFKVLCYTLFIFLVVDLNGGFYGFLLIFIPTVLCAMSSSAFCHFMSASFESIATASLITVPIDFMGVIFSGPFIRLDTLPTVSAWLKYVSQFFYGIEAISISQWKVIHKIDCPSDPEEPCISNGMDVLKRYGYRSDHYSIDCLGLLSIFVICHFAGYLAMRIRSQKEPVY